MGWILWLLLFAAAAADLVLLVLLLRMRDKMQKQQRTDHKALKREKQELTAIRRELCHERDIIGLIQEHMAARSTTKSWLRSWKALRRWKRSTARSSAI